MKVSNSTSGYYEEAIHQQHKTELLRMIIEQYKREYLSETDYKGHLQPKAIIKLLHHHQVKMYTLFDLFFHNKECMRELVFEKIIKLWYRQKPRKVTKLCDLYGVICKESANKSVTVEVPTKLSQKRGKNFKARKIVHYV